MVYVGGWVGCRWGGLVGGCWVVACDCVDGSGVLTAC